MLFCRSEVLSFGKVLPLLLYTLPALAQLTPEQKAANLESFRIVWETVRDHHPDPTMNGLDWQSIFYKTKPIVENCRNMNEMRGALRGMLALLGSSHYAIIPGEAYSAAEPAAAEDDASPGFETSVIEGRAVVSRVRPDSPADQAGIKPGMVIAGINGSQVAPLLRALDRAKASESSAVAVRSIEQRLVGPADSQVTIDLLDSKGHAQHIEVLRANPSGDLVSFANLPPMRVEFESKQLKTSVGYIRLNAFLDPAKVMPEFEGALKRFRSAPGVILDLRGNPGGIGVMAMGIAGFFVDQEGLELGEMEMRGTTIKFAVFPRAHPFMGRLAVLVDEGSASTSEILAQGLRDLGRAHIFGARTAGAALPSDIIRLPNGDGFQYAQARYTSAKGRVLEGNGVVPDVEIHRSAADLEAGRDPVLDAAGRWITTQ